MCHCGAVVKELLAPTDKPGSTTGDAVFSFFVRFFFCLVSFEHYFSFWHFFVILTADPAGARTWINIYFKRKSGAYFGKGISKALDLHTGQAYAPINVMPAGGGGRAWSRDLIVWRYLTADSDEKTETEHVSRFHASRMHRTVWKDLANHGGQREQAKAEWISLFCL